MDLTDVIILVLLISILILCVLGFGIYFLNIQYQKQTIDKQLAIIQEKTLRLDDESEYGDTKSMENNLPKQQMAPQMAPQMPPQMAPQMAPQMPPGVPINIPTRGMEEYRQLGILTSLSDSKIVIPLYGRRTYVRSQHWNYYTLTNGYQSIQISVSNKNKDCSEEYGCDEIYSDDLIYIPAYNENFRALMYKNNAPRYIPYI
uniref:Uncharacterized protein n=1 Tax=viral metagenome TaxID=1070528 RepID=A0A6C0CVG7_9ZZZZ